MPPASTSTTDEGPLSPDQQEQLALANRRAKKVLGAAKVATFNGWSIGLFAAIGLLFAMFSFLLFDSFSFTTLVMGIGLAVVARNEFRGRDLLRSFSPHGPRLLGKNQLGFMSLLIVYCLWNIYGALTNPITEIEGMEALAEAAGDLVTSLTVAVYGVVIVVSVLIQGLNARYYFVRARLVEDYVRETPEWIVELQRSSSVL